mgnify:CR=1 FL=1
MKLTKSKLKRIIQEELKKARQEEGKFKYDPCFKPKKSIWITPTWKEIRGLDKELEDKRKIDTRHESPCLSEDFIVKLTDLHDRATCGKWSPVLMYDFMALKRQVRDYVKEHCAKQSRNIPWSRPTL